MTNDDTDFTIIVDTREQQPWIFKGYATANRKLDAGDYSIECLENLFSIERKKSVSEIANNIVESRFKDAIARLAEHKYSFLLLEFDIQDVLQYPIGSTLPRRLWNKVKVKPAFIMKHVLDWQLKHNINVVFCGNSDNAEKVAEYIFKKIYYLEVTKKNKEQK